MTSLTSGYKLFTPITIGKDLVVKNRIVMAPMTRARADPITQAPNELNELYYEQRSGAGLIITEGVCISEQAAGWPGAPSIYNDTHVEGWKKVVDRVHKKDSKIFLQLWHLGRQGHRSLNKKNDLISASAIGVSQGTVRNAKGESVPYEVPRALETDEVINVAKDYAHAAACAKKAGFDGVEIHAANGYLVDQFLQSISNHRTDKYGGSIENRARFLLEIIEEIKKVYPSDRIGVRLSPNSAFGGMGSEDYAEQFTYVFEQLSEHNLAYLAILDGFGFGRHDKGQPLTAFDAKSTFKGTVIAHNSYTRDIAEGAIRSGCADLVGFGRDYISTPDLAERFENDWPLNPPADYSVYWDGTKGAEGYTDFPTYSSKE